MERKKKLLAYKSNHIVSYRFSLLVSQPHPVFTSPSGIPTVQCCRGIVTVSRAKEGMTPVKCFEQKSSLWKTGPHFNAAENKFKGNHNKNKDREKQGCKKKFADLISHVHHTSRNRGVSRISPLNAKGMCSVVTKRQQKQIREEETRKQKGV